jgi:hypothetical protein
MAKTFNAELESVGPTGAWTRLILPFNVEKEFGSRGRVPVKGTINGFAFRTSIFPNGDSTHHMMVNKVMQQGANAKPGDKVRLTLTRDDVPKAMEIPPELKHAFTQHKRVAAAFDKLPPSHRREHIRHILEARKPQTRQRRIERIIAQLVETKKS